MLHIANSEIAGTVALGLWFFFRQPEPKRTSCPELRPPLPLLLCLALAVAEKKLWFRSFLHTLFAFL